jgi:hypothetical protein
MIDYKEAVKKLISETYAPADMISKEVEKTTQELVSSFRNVMPTKALDEHVVTEALFELGYTPKEKEPLEFIWYFKRNDKTE